MDGMTAGTVREAYQRDGYVFPIRVMDEDTATRHRFNLERAEAIASNVPGGDGYFREYSNISLGFVGEIARSPAVTDPVAEILGEDLLVMSSSFFIKEANSPAYVSWHQDLHYWGLDGDDEVTAWIALSPATRESGAMRFVPGSHTEIVAHADTFHADNLLTRGQEVAVEVDEEDAVAVELAPGEMSLHHGRLFHASDPNRTDDRRIGLAIRYIPTRMGQAVGGICATLVRGEDRFGNFDLVESGSRLLAPEDLARHREVCDRRRKVIMRESQGA
ncbi:MAG: phytanoyl-CoA dioxygenase family protein [Pseudomonadota bacterium]